MEIEPLAEPPDATVVVPGSKSITNRALLLAALAEGRTVLRGALMADDTEAMIDAARVLGASVDASDGTLRVTGVGGRLPDTPVMYDARQAATVARFITAVSAAGRWPAFVDGDPQLRARPIQPLVDALLGLGARVYSLAGAPGLPLRVEGPPERRGVDVGGDVSSQFLSALLLAGPLYPDGVELRLTTALVSRPYVAITGAVMASFGYAVGEHGGAFVVEPGTYASPGDYVVEPDASSASYFFAAAAITGGRVRVEGLGAQSLQGDVQLVHVLRDMGAAVTVADDHIEVAGRATKGVDVTMTDFSDMVPTLAVVAAAAESPTTIRGVGFVRGKESDRIGAVAAGLRTLGVGVTETDDGLVIEPAPLHGGLVVTHGDHRLAMAFALLGLVRGGVVIDDPACVAKTFPGYFVVLDELRSRRR